MIYVKHIKISPVRSRTGFLMWQASYYINRRGAWDFVKSELYYLSASAFAVAQKLKDDKNVRIITN